MELEEKAEEILEALWIRNEDKKKPLTLDELEVTGEYAHKAIARRRLYFYC